MATPGRSTRARSRQPTPASHAPLPAVDTRQSHAYGAKGKAHLKHQVVEQHTNFAEAFASGRDADVPASVAEESEEEDLSSEQPGTRNGTVVDSVARYEPSFTAAAMPPPPTTRRAAPRSTMRSTVEMPPDRDAAEPWTISVFLRAIPRYFWRNTGALLLGALLLTVFITMPMKGYMEQRRDRMIRAVKIFAGLPGYEHPPSHLEALWNQIRYNHTMSSEDLPTENVPGRQWSFNINFLSRIQAVENATTGLEDDMAELQKYLPPRMVVDLTENGNMALKEEFWKALLAKLEGSDVLYDRFTASNGHLIQQMTDSAATHYYDDAFKSQRILDRQAVMGLVRENNEKLAARFSQLLKESTSGVLQDAKSLAASVATETVKKTPSDAQVQLALMAKSTLLHNTLEALHMVNHFSLNLGARVDPYNTSPAQAKSQNFVARAWMGGTFSAGKPATYALSKWEEMGDCWCAAESNDRGKAQLAVILGHEVYPDRLIIDHIPARGTLGIAAAPRDFELWVETDNVEQADIFREKIIKLLNDYNIQSCMTETSPPSKSAICVGQGRYDIHGDNWVQSFQTFVDTREIGLKTNKIFFRATSNWGAPHTCIYRLRLTGHYEEAMEDLYDTE